MEKLLNQVKAEAHDADYEDEDVPPKAMKLSEARDALLKCQIFFKENQDDPAMRPIVPQMGNMLRVVERKIYSSRTVRPSIIFYGQ